MLPLYQETVLFSNFTFNEMGDFMTRHLRGKNFLRAKLTFVAVLRYVDVILHLLQYGL